MHVNILKRPSNHPSSVVQNIDVTPNMKKVTIEISSEKSDSPRTVSFGFITKSDDKIFKPKQLLKPNVPSKVDNK